MASQDEQWRHYFDFGLSKGAVEPAFRAMAL
jgi:hypothetical protein